MESYGLTCKAPERLKDGARVFGLHVQDNGGMLDRKRGSDVPEIPLIIVQKAVFSMCGKLVGHFRRVARSGLLYQMPCDYRYVWLGRRDSGCPLERDDNRRDGQSTPESPSARKVVCDRCRICRMGGRELPGYWCCATGKWICHIRYVVAASRMRHTT